MMRANIIGVNPLQNQNTSINTNPAEPIIRQNAPMENPSPNPFEATQGLEQFNFQPPIPLGEHQE